MTTKNANTLVTLLITVVILILGYFIITQSLNKTNNAKSQYLQPAPLNESGKSSLYKSTVEKAKNSVDAVNKINEQAKDLLPGN